MTSASSFPFHPTVVFDGPYWVHDFSRPSPDGWTAPYVFPWVDTMSDALQCTPPNSLVACATITLAWTWEDRWEPRFTPLVTV